ncbi:hypothetical protein EJ05DRAFT_195232 [Pseudovirgaria hyperparasitica]|uniref:Uncharacterized protein n=1 Tax=Pseudovirgaria hyperparasitica TaxID=470096 RepID=A0A6A6WIS6_9PEZI|nr:uncharacterized protein EJ05DRAFT_195232 [Pseudovirgaria hyperparasitica]KAF2762054.1 hypothetical protein EJ05DRAFT_195232 [Pseudovirgaria hyperparasitica]
MAKYGLLSALAVYFYHVQTLVIVLCLILARGTHSCTTRQHQQMVVKSRVVHGERLRPDRRQSSIAKRLSIVAGGTPTRSSVGCISIIVACTHRRLHLSRITAFVNLDCFMQWGYDGYVIFAHIGLEIDGRRDQLGSLSSCCGV